MFWLALAITALALTVSPVIAILVILEINRYRPPLGPSWRGK
jgi:hypothetical protein